jgi:hypothetical protein
MNHTILELLLNLSGNYIELGKVTQNSVLFKQKKKKNDIDLHWEFYLKKNKRGIFNSEKESDEETQSTEDNLQNIISPKKQKKELFIIGNINEII